MDHGNVLSHKSNKIAYNYEPLDFIYRFIYIFQAENLGQINLQAY